MIKFFQNIGDALSMIWSYIVTTFDQAKTAITSVSNGWDFLSESFLPGAPEEIRTFLYSVLVVGIGALIGSILRGRD